MGKANGKVILFGEHAVVYGVPAIAAGIDRGASARAVRGDQPALRVGNQHVSSTDGSELGAAYAALLDSLEAPPLCTTVELELPAGCGLGASAAIGVATARAVLEAIAGPPPDGPEHPSTTERILAAANAWERVFHGNPSGVDAAAATLGGVIWFDRTGGARPLPIARPLTLALAIAGPPAATREMVASVAELQRRRPAIVDKALGGIHALVRNARICLEQGDLPSLGQLMNLNHMLLSGLFLSTEDIERACGLARDVGALGAKLTGAGGGGAVIALVDDPEPVLRVWRNEGFESFTTTVRPAPSA